MNSVLTSEEAKKITGGRTPLLPVEYEEAVKQLVACTSLDEAKYWSTKADVLAAWAKIYRDDRTGVEAKRLKLHAYRRMDELSREIARATKGSSTKRTSAKSVLVGSGLSVSHADVVRRIGRIGADEFKKIVESPRPPAPTTLSEKRVFGTEAWKWFTGSNGVRDFRIFCRRHQASAMAKELLPDEAVKAAVIIREIIDWLDEFEQHLSKTITQ